MVGWFFQTAACLLGPSPRQREEADDAHWLGIDGRVLTLVLIPLHWLSAANDDVDDEVVVMMMVMMRKEELLFVLYPLGTHIQAAVSRIVDLQH